MMHWHPDRSAARARLEVFVPAAGDTYAEWRNHDFGPGDRSNVSALSPWIASRRLTETEVLDAVLARHDATAAERFIHEVCWRTWSKGWLERHPGTWPAWRQAVEDAAARLRQQPGSTRVWHNAINGRTGIACFDTWVHELIEHGYLHNHARMWFASIWVFTLELPPALGAAFFLQHLLDGDAASNTLGWRWVAGWQTPGKTYLATAENIKRFTQDRFHPAGQLATVAPALTLAERPPAEPAPSPDPVPAADAATGLLLTPEDLGIESLDLTGIRHAAVLHDPAAADDIDKTEPARQFRTGLVNDTVTALEAAGIDARVLTDVADVAHWCVETALARIWLVHIPIGPVRDHCEGLRDRLQAAGVALHECQRSWDANAWPHAGAGFFPFRRQIPGLLAAAGLTSQ